MSSCRATNAKDGGPKSKVMGYWFIRIKSLFTVALLRFAAGSREAYHSHAFDSVSWVLTGSLREVLVDGTERLYRPSWRPVVTRRNTFHKVYGLSEDSWVLTFRGPWVDRWHEVDETGQRITLTHNRVEI